MILQILGGRSMRITNQMLANSAAQSGILLQRTTLLDVMNNKSSSGLLGCIGNNNRISASKILNKNNYSKLEELSGNLNKYASKLSDTDKDSIYDKAKESGNTKDILSGVCKMVEAYNATIKQLKITGGTMNEFYRQKLKEIPAGCKEALKDIGITQEKDGSLSMDEKTLQNADADALKKAMESKTGFASKLSFVSNRINQNASANVISASSQYTSNGSAFMGSFEESKYNFWG